jgi:AcrR family transcriptional regulator
VPRVVDKDARRAEIVDAYLTLVKRDGLAKATTRALAKELGMAVGGLWVYFGGVDEIRLAAFERAYDFATGPLSEPCDPGLAGLVHALAAILPTRETSMNEARLSITFMEDEAIRDGVYRIEQKIEKMWRDAFASHLNEAKELGELTANADPDDLADVLLALAVGIQMGFLVGSPYSAGQRMWDLVELTMRPWLADGESSKRFSTTTGAESALV